MTARVEVDCVGVAFHLVHITSRLQETLPLLKEKCQGFDSFLESKMVWVPRCQHEHFLFVPFIWFSGSFTSGYVDTALQGCIFPTAFMKYIMGGSGDFDNMKFLYYTWIWNLTLVREAIPLLFTLMIDNS